MKKTNRSLSILLIMLMLFCVVPLQSAFAAKTVTAGKVGNNIAWSYSKHTLTLSGKGKMDTGLDRMDYPWYTFRNSIKKLIVKDGVTSVAYGAFYQYKNLSAISLANSVIDVDGNAFYGTAWYKSQKKGVLYLNQIACGYRGNMPEGFALEIKDGTKSIGTSAFARSDSLHSVSIPGSVSYIGEDAFGRCDQLTEVEVPDTLRYVGGYAFAETPWLQMQPNGIIYLGKVAYCYKGEMPTNTVLKVKKGTITIAPTAFYGKENLVRVQIPDSVTTIGYDAFHGSGIKKLYIPKSVKVIEGNKVGARFMKRITVDSENPTYSSDDTGCLFNKKKTQIYEYPGFNKTKTYQIPGTVKSVQALCFDGTQYLETLVIPASVKSLDLYAIHYADSLTAFRVSKKNPYYSSDTTGCLYNKDKTTLLRYPSGKTDASFTLPKQVKKIGPMAFLQAWSLQTLKMYDNVTTIGSDAFYRCYSLENIRFSKNITSIEGQLFSYIPWVDKQPEGVIYIGKVAYSFRGDGKEVVIQNGTVSIADYAFAGWRSIKTVKIPKSVKSIGYGAFADSSGIIKIQINNPNCTIPMEKDTFPKKAVLYAASGSTTQTYAKKFGRTFVSL